MHCIYNTQAQYIYIYIYKHTYIYIYIHIYTCTQDSDVFLLLYPKYDDGVCSKRFSLTGAAVRLPRESCRRRFPIGAWIAHVHVPQDASADCNAS